MSRKLSIETKVRRLVNWIDSIQKGNIQVPKFQRDFIWELNNIKDLFDSIKNGYPIGSILLWKPEVESFERNELMGSFKLLEPENKEYWYVLDGFQRLCSLFNCLSDPNKYEQIEKELWKKNSISTTICQQKSF